MIEEKISFKKRISNSIQEIRKYPKIWISVLALSSLVIGFIGGLGVDNFSNQTSSYENMKHLNRDGEKLRNSRSDENFRKSHPNTESNQDDTDATSGASQNDSSQSSTN